MFDDGFRVGGSTRGRSPTGLSFRSRREGELFVSFRVAPVFHPGSS